MGRLVFGDEQARKRLEAIVHPLVFERIVELEQEAPSDAVVVHDIPLLAEAGRAGGVRPRDRRRRPARGAGGADAGRARLDRGGRPVPDQRRRRRREDRRAIATHVIENTGTREDLRKRVAEVYAEVVSAGSRDD